jgi:hypothetical protein
LHDILGIDVPPQAAAQVDASQADQSPPVAIEKGPRLGIGSLRRWRHKYI